MSNAVIIIPARLQSTRLKRKLLLPLGKKSVLQHTIDRATQSSIQRVIVATDSDEIADHVRHAEVFRSQRTHRCGSDRIAEAAEDIHCDIVINVQGDEPFFPPAVATALVDCFQDPTIQMASVRWPILSSDDFYNPHVVKVVCDQHDRALYFSRSPLPYQGNTFTQGYGHLGIYAFRKEKLLRYAKTPPSSLEIAENLEQLRALQLGWNIKMIDIPHPILNINTPEDLTKARHMLSREKDDLTTNSTIQDEPNADLRNRFR